MAKTFDTVYEQMGSNYMYLSALIVVTWSRAPVVPPPFAVLGLPYMAAQHGFSLGHYRKCCSRCPWALTEGDYASQEDEEDNAPKMEVSTVPELKEKMEAYVAECAGEQGEDDKWRTQMAKQQARMERQQVKLTSNVQQQVERVAKLQADAVQAARQQADRAAKQVKDMQEQMAKHQREVITLLRDNQEKELCVAGLVATNVRVK
eukprot:2062050-Prymnesium_polylepis.2